MLDRAMNGGEYAVTRSIISIQRRSTWLSKIKRKSNEGEFFRNESCGKKNRIKDLISTIITFSQSYRYRPVFCMPECR